MPKHPRSKPRPRRPALRRRAPNRSRNRTSPPRSSPPLVTLALEWFLNPDHLPFVVAKEHGFFRDEGMDVSIVVPTVPEESLDLVGRGKADFGVGEQTNLIRARDHGRRLISIAPLLTGTVVCLMYLKNGPITRLADLRDRRIGWPGLEIDLPILGSMLDAAGLSHDDIVPVDVGFALTDALLTGKADAVFGAFRNYEQVEAQLRGADIEFVSPSDYGVPDLYQLVVMTSDTMMARHPQIVRGFSRALSRGLAFTHEHPDEALGLYLKANPMADPTLSAKTFHATLPYFPETLRQEADRWKAVRDWLHRRGVIRTRMPLSDLFSNACVPRR
ncbi:MAG TPA: ABC transporter substrate-binding protein [Nitrospiraceae bacterium]|jgi:putative hydroxymethylpyrimidine transport system substrate-binding protein|nr:ABC transporter substrate-binding protein [Nitrospiraceae bacterium]